MKTPNTPIILGLDPGYGRLGWAVGRKKGHKWQELHFGCIETPKNLSLFERYQLLEQKLNKLITQYQPDEAAIETVFFAKNQTAMLKISEVRGAIIGILIRQRIPVTEYNPMQIKQAVTGNGRADKKAVAKMIGLELRLETKKVIDDAIDALAIMMTHQARIKI